MHPRNRSTRKAVTSDVPHNKAVETRSVHELARQAGYLLFLCVFVSFFPSSLPSILAKSMRELVVFLRYSIFLMALLDILTFMGYFTTRWSLMLMFVLRYVPIFTLAPRFILSIRELYGHDMHGRHGGGIDTGLSSSDCDHVRGCRAERGNYGP